MKNPNFLIMLLLCPVLSFGQIGIGTTSPHSKAILDLTSTSKGLLIPRMTCVQRLAMGLTAADRGMVVFQTDIPSNPPYHPSGLYTYDGTTWVAPLSNASAVGYTMRWDGTKWGPTSNLFNQGTSIGIGTTSPKSQLHIHSTAAPVSRIQISNPSSIYPASTPSTKDGLILGMGPSGEAFINQQEEKPLIFAIDSVEYLRINAEGNVGINTNEPSATLDVDGTVQLGSHGITVDDDGRVGINEDDPDAALDVKGTVKLGEHGTPLTGILRKSTMLDIPLLLGGQELPFVVPFENANLGATVLVSPSLPLTGIVIGYAMVAAPGVIEIKFSNLLGLPIDVTNMMFYITVIQ